jgi:hypothetical protein
MQAPPDLPNCLELKESQRADCYVASTSDRQGFVVYDNYRGCLNSWLAVPGFMLLPTWALASEHMANRLDPISNLGVYDIVFIVSLYAPT